MTTRALELVVPWIEQKLGRAVNLDINWPVVSVTDNGTANDAEPFLLFRTGMAVNGSVCSEWQEDVEQIASELHPDILFSPLGCYDLSRMTLTTPARRSHDAGTGIWGPVPSYIADSSMWMPVDDGRPVKLSELQPGEVDWSVFWHCARQDLLAAFGIFDEDGLQALATVVDKGAGLMEIGVDVAPVATGQRLGSAVVSAAGNWILENGGFVYATAAAWNVPSARNLRRLGMQYACSNLVGLPAPFRQPPQPLGAPLPGAEMMDQYPRWAMNDGIRPKAEE